MRQIASREGVLRALFSVFSQGAHLLWDYLPRQRRLRYGDLQFDWDFGVNTTWSNLPLRLRLRDIFCGGHGYQPTDPAYFAEMIGALEIDHSRFTFIDIGSGKGRVLLMASGYPFRKIVGVEVIAELVQIAQENLSRFAPEQRRCPDIELWQGDARHFPFPPESAVVYLFNPFPECVMAELLRNLEASLCQCPRRLYLVFHNLPYARLLDRSHALAQVRRTHAYSIYKSVAIPREG